MPGTDTEPIQSYCPICKEPLSKSDIDYPDGRQSSRWTLTFDSKTRSLLIKIDPPPDGNFYFDGPHHDNEMVFTLDELKDMIKRIEA